MSSAYPAIALSGVLSSWLMIVRNSLFARFARSTSARASRASATAVRSASSSRSSSETLGAHVHQLRDVLHPVDDGFDGAVRTEHRRVHRAPPPFLESPAGSRRAADVVLLHRHPVRPTLAMTRSSDARRFLTPSRPDRRGCRGIRRTDRGPTMRSAFGHRRPQVRVVHRDDREPRRTEDEIRRRGGVEQRLEIRPVRQPRSLTHVCNGSVSVAGSVVVPRRGTAGRESMRRLVRQPALLAPSI